MRRLASLIRSGYARLRAASVGHNRPQAAPKPPTIEAPDDDALRYEQARNLHQSGKLDDAEAIFRSLLHKYPDDFDLLHLLGVVQGQRNNFDAAIELIEQALAVESGSAAAHCSLGNCLRGLGRHEAALASYDRALSIQMNDASTLNNRGATLRDLGRLDEALACFDRALAINANHDAALANRGMTLRQLGRPEEALISYNKLSTIRPDSIEVLNICGTLLRELHRPDAALGCFENVLRLTPDAPAAHFNCGVTLADLGKYELALASYERALVHNPDDVSTLCNRGITLHCLKRYDDALASIERALHLQPDHVEVLINRGAILREIRQYHEALQSFDRILAGNPGLAIAHCNRGTVLADLGRYEDALAGHDRALAIDPDAVEAHVGRSVALRGLGRHDEALRAVDKALAIKPDRSTSLICRSLVLGDLNRFEEALDCLDRAIVLQPDSADAHNNRGTLLFKLRRPEDALVSYGKALTLNPDHTASLINRGDLLTYLKHSEAAARDYTSLAALEPNYPYVQGYVVRARMACCDWRDFDSLKLRLSNDARCGKKAGEPFHCISIFDAPELLKRTAENFVADRFAPTRINPPPFEIRNDGKIRLGYVAGEFRHHATSILMVELFERHDTSRFEVFAFDNGWDDGSALRKRLNQAFTEIVDISRLSDHSAASAIRDRGIDILIDLNGHVGRKRTGIFSMRAAPVQVNWLGFPGTMGAEFMDYIIGDRVIMPEGHDADYTEKIVRLPDSYQVNDSKRPIAGRTPTRAEVGLPDASFVFCCFNDSYKITPDVFQVWMRLLKRLEHSMLWLVEGDAAASRNLRSQAIAHGIEPGRLVFAPRMDLPAHLARHRLGDLFLDTLPYNAHTTASDALWAGLPLLTCMGSTFAGRVAGSLLHAIGLPELVTDNLTDYEALAFKLATTPALLSELRARLSRNRDTHPLFDTDRFRRHIESAYITMHERRLSGKKPDSFTVAHETTVNHG